MRPRPPATDASRQLNCTNYEPGSDASQQGRLAYAPGIPGLAFFDIELHQCRLAYAPGSYASQQIATSTS